MKRLLPLLLLFILALISPAWGANQSALNPQVSDIQVIGNPSAGFTYNTASEGYVLSRTGIMLLPGQSISFNYGFNDGSSVAGSISVGITGEEMHLGGYDHSWTVINLPNIASYYYITPAVDLSSGSPVYALVMVKEQASIGGDQVNYLNPAVTIRSDHIVAYPLAVSPSTNPPISMTITGGGATTITLVKATLEDVYAQEAVQENPGQNFVDFVISILGSLWDFLMFIWFWFKFFFIDNLIMTLILVEGGMLAYTMTTSRNIFQFFERAIQNNVKLFNFLINFARAIIGFIGDLIQLVNPMRYLTGR